MKVPHGEERGTRVSNHETPMHLILRDAAKTPLLGMRRVYYFFCAYSSGTDESTITSIRLAPS
jgi:hypothetical protein